MIGENNMTKEQLQDLLTTAFEGGANYWYMIDNHNKSETKAEFLSQLLAEKNGWMEIIDTQTPESEIYTVDYSWVKRAIETMKTKYPRHYKDVIEENADATTGDVFLQLIVFNEVIYG